MQLDGRREAQRPPRQIVDDLPPGSKPGFALRCASRLAWLAALRGLHRPGIYNRKTIVEEPVKVDTTFFVALRYKDVPEAMALNRITAPCVQLAYDGCAVMAIHLARVQREGDEPPELIGERQAPNLRPCASHAPLPVFSFRIGAFALFLFLGNGPPRAAVVLGKFPASAAEIRRRAGYDILQPARVCIHLRGVPKGA